MSDRTDEAKRLMNELQNIVDKYQMSRPDYTKFGILFVKILKLAQEIEDEEGEDINEVIGSKDRNTDNEINYGILGPMPVAKG